MEVTALIDSQVLHPCLSLCTLCVAGPPCANAPYAACFQSCACLTAISFCSHLFIFVMLDCVAHVKLAMAFVRSFQRFKSMFAYTCVCSSFLSSCRRCLRWSRSLHFAFVLSCLCFDSHDRCKHPTGHMSRHLSVDIAGRCDSALAWRSCEGEHAPFLWASRCGHQLRRNPSHATSFESCVRSLAFSTPRTEQNR